MSPLGIIVLIVCCGICLTAMVFLQISLSKKKSPWPGLVLPALVFILSLFVLLANVAYLDTPTLTVEVLSESGEVIEEAVRTAPEAPDGITILGLSLGLGWLFFLLNLETLLYLGIYFWCRRTFRRAKGIEHMRAQDL